MGVSGGADSICLLHLLSQCGYPLTALHFDHQIRPESKRDADFVEDFCARHQIPCVVGRGDVPALAAQWHMSVEEAARVARYQFLFSAARQAGAAALATAHHAGDQAETILMHFIRGSGISGLRGMSQRALLPEYDPALPLIRPLLFIRKEDILVYCREQKLDFVSDTSNGDNTYFRNWLRNDLIPQIESRNPRFKETLLRTGQVLSADAEVLQDALNAEWQKTCLSGGDGFRKFRYTDMLGLSTGLLRALSRRAIGELRPGLRDIDFEDVERFCDFVHHPSETRKVDLVAGLELRLSGDLLTLCESGLVLPVEEYPQWQGDAVELSMGRFALSNGWEIVLEEKAVGECNWQDAPGGEAWLDPDKIQGRLVLRTRRPGDRMELLGAGGHSAKISDILINHKIPVEARQAYPLVADSEKILWVPDIRINDTAKVSEETKRVIHLVLKRLG